MSITTDQLKRLLTGMSGSTFTLSAQQLGSEKVAQLFNAYLPGSTLTVQHANVDVGKLAVAGQMTLGNAQDVQSSVVFLTSGMEVSGIVITMELTSWELKTPFVTFPGNLLRDFGFLHPHLILRADESDHTTSDLEAMLDASLQIQTSTGTKVVTLVTQIPSGTNPYHTNFVFQAEFNGVTLADLSALTQFVHTANFAFIPSPIPVASTLEMKGLQLVVDPSDDEIVSLQIDVRSGTGLKIVEGVFEISEFLFSFDVLFPTTSASVYADIEAGFNIYGQVINASLSIPDLFFEGDLAYDHPIPLKPFAAHFLPTEGLPDFSISGMRFVIGLLEPHDYLFEIALTNDRWHLPLGGKQVDLTELQASVAGAGTEKPALTLIGQVTFAGTTLYLAAQRAEGSGDWTFEADTVVLSEINVESMLAELVHLSGAIPTTLPPEIPSISLSSLNITTVPNGGFDVAARCITTWDLPFGVAGLSVGTLDFALQRRLTTGGDQVTCSIELHSDTLVTIVEGLSFNSMDLSFNLDQQTKNWVLSGIVSGTLFSADVTFAASLHETPMMRTIMLEAKEASPSPLLDLGEVGSLTCTDISIIISKPLQPTANAGAVGISLSSSSAYRWSVQATGGITLTDIFTLNGTLALSKTSSGASLIFQPTVAQASVSLPEPLHGWTTNLGLESLSLVETTVDPNKKAWILDTTVAVWFSGLPANLQAIVPSATSKVNGRFKADSSGVQVLIDRVVAPVAFSIPSSHAIDLGKAMIDLSNLVLTPGRHVTLSLDVGIGIPEKLNNIFGTKKDGSPVLPLFNTYVSGNAASVTKFGLHVSSSNGLQALLVTSPLKAITITSDGKSSWCNTDLGEFGAVRFMVPTFSYSEGKFTGSGDLTQVRPLKVPLTPMKWLLNASGLHAIADRIPDGLPIQELKIYDTATGHFNADALIKLIEGAGIPLDSDIKSAISAIEGQLDKLPDRFKSYLDIVTPKQIHFELSITNSGSIRADVTVDKSTPIKLLFPGIGPLGPQLNGIELYGFSIGEMLDGLLLLLNLDLCIDQFSLLTLLAALVLPLDKLPILPRSQDLVTRITLHNLFMLLIYETAIPTPVPLFYDLLGLDYLGLEGIALQSHWSFPKPQLSPADAGRIFTNFEKFFTDHNYLLDASVPPQQMDLRLTIGPNYLQLPQYLGGAMLGSRDKTITISAYTNLAHLLNALKTLSLNELIQAIPLDDRVGKERVSFACMTLEVDWLITTPQEFRTISYQRLAIVESEISPMLQVIPPSPQKNEQGLVLFLKGAWQLSTLASLDVNFGLIGTDAGFGTGMRVAGKISDWLDTEISGVVVIDPKAHVPFALNGHSYLAIANRHVFEGDVQIDDQHFYMNGQLTLFPPSSPLQISGSGQARIDNHGQIYLHTAVNVSLQNFVLNGSEITITNTSLEIAGSWLGRTMTLLIVIEGNDFTLSGTVTFNLGLNIQVGPIYEPITGLKVVDQLALNTALDASFKVALGTHGFAADVNASFKWNAYTLNVPPFHIAVAPQDIAAMTKLLADEIEQHASAIFAEVFKNMDAWLKAGVDGLVQVTAQLAPAVEAAHKWSAAAWNATEQWSVHAWQDAYQWDGTAWDATTRWSDSAWNATTKWGNTAWDATTKWSDATWKDTARWTNAVWNDTANWSTAQWNDAINTANNLLRSLHTDTSTPHLDAPAVHVDTPSTPHVDIAATHVDTAPTAHIDIPAIHEDTQITPHGDTHADWAFVDTHTDIPRSHIDTTSSPHGDTQAIPHIDRTSTPHADTSGIPHGDTSTPHGDTAAKHVDVTP